MTNCWQNVHILVLLRTSNIQLVPQQINSINKQLMRIVQKHSPIITLLALSCLLWLTTPNVYYKSSDDFNTRSSYFLPFLPQGSIVTALVDIQGAAVPFNIELWRPLSYPPNSPDEFVVLTDGAQYKSSPLSVPGSWRVVISPLYVTSPQFQYTISLSVNNQSVGKYVDVARYNRIFIIYHTLPGKRSINITVPTGFAGQAVPYLYGPFESLTVSGGIPVSNNQQASRLTINYQTKGKQYYYLSITQTPSMISSGVLLNVQYETDKFQCPYTNDFTDYNGVFTGCSNILPTQGFPCIAYNERFGICQYCQPPWVVDSIGVCNINTACPQGQYFNLGNCYNALANCKDFELTGGKCNSCQPGFNLQNYNNGTQECTVASKVCSSNQYLFGNNCFNYVDNCANQETSTGVCSSCKFGFELKQNKCNKIVVKSANCQLGYKSVNGFCQPIDENCIFYHDNNTCMVCQPGYLLKKTCQKIICGSRQYSGTGQCLDVSQLCATFDPINGRCLTCIGAPNQYYLQNDGKCLQSVPNQNYAAASSICPDNYYNREGTCVEINPLCGTFDQRTGACTTCLDNTYYLNPSGGCVLISSYCTTYRTYFSNGNCFNVAKECDTYDPSDGRCLSCRDMTKLTPDGRCLYDSNCVGRQYSLSNGQCADVSKSCGDFDKFSGACLTCAQGYELNPGGICCYALNYLLDPNCIGFFKTNCATNFKNPLFPYCTKCSVGYSLTNGVYGRCNPTAN